jgi:hypothetical protein
VKQIPADSRDNNWEQIPGRLKPLSFSGRFTSPERESGFYSLKRECRPAVADRRGV